MTTKTPPPWGTPDIIRYDASKKSFCDEIRADLPLNICPMPFTTLILNPDGRVGFCRERTNNDVVGDIRKESLEEIWNGKRIREIRREFLEGKISTCKCQIRDRRCYDQAYNQIILPYTDFSEVQKNPPLRLSPDFNGQCNLRCVTCDIWKLPNGLYDQLGFWEKAEKEIFPHLKMLDPLAGEPFIQKDHFRLMDLMAKINPDCAWRFTTNLHWKFDERIKGYLDRIKNIYSFIVSIDAVTPETYYKVRHPGNLHLVWETLDRLIDYRKERMDKRGPNERFGITAAMALHSENWHEAPEFMRWGHKKGIEPALQGVYLPEDISIFKIPSLEKRRSILDFFIKEMDYSDLIKIFRITTPLMATFPEELESEYKAKIIQRFFEVNHDIVTVKACGFFLPRFLMTFPKLEQEKFTRSILDFALKNYELPELQQMKKSENFLSFLIHSLPEKEQQDYNKAFFQKFKKLSPADILEHLLK